MFRGKSDGAPESSQPGFQGLPRDTIDKVQSEKMKAGLAGCFDGLDGLFGIVPPSQEGQNIGGKGLDAQVEPVNPQFSKGLQKRKIQVSRIGLQGEFRRPG